VLKAVYDAGLRDDTLVIVTSDNGCAPAIGIPKLEEMGHYPSAEFRGYKSDIWDGGHRVPFLVRWPGKIKASTQSAQVVCLTDLIATCADIRRNFPTMRVRIPSACCLFFLARTSSRCVKRW
jgi:arylsulfatase A-like enzyme